jgi:uncharacterized protein
MLAYLATKSQFIADAPQIEDIVRERVKVKLGHKVGDSEYKSWQNSLGRAMFHVLNTDEIAHDSAIAIEYRVNGRAFRIDFMIAGKNSLGEKSIFIIELKQWSEIRESEIPGHVNTLLGGGWRDVLHPAYQAWAYMRHLQDFNEFIYESKVKVNACVYLHNSTDARAINSSDFENKMYEVPVLIKHQSAELRKLIKSNVSQGIGTELIQEIDASAIRPSQQLADAIGSILNGKEEFILIDDQKTVFEKILLAARKGQSGDKQVLIIKGGPGTGKSVISMNTIAKLTSDRMNVKYVTPNAAPRAVFSKQLKLATNSDHFANLFTGSGSFTSSDRNSFDALIVDEAHRLKMKSGMFSNLGENQTKEIINSAKTSVFFIDEAQQVTWADVGEVSMICDYAIQAGAEVQILELKSQFRCSGSDDYMAWLDKTLGIDPGAIEYFDKSKFDFKVFDSPSEMHHAIRLANQVNNKSRVVAGYCWDWISKKNFNLSDIFIEDSGYSATWNLSAHGGEWIINPDSIDQVGCIHTAQGLEVDYVGVIIGPDLRMQDGVMVTDPAARAKTDKSLKGFKKELKSDPDKAQAKADRIIRNTYRTLMTRGLKGCYVYCVDPELSSYFKSALPD